MKEITPERLRCAFGTCPAVFLTATGSLVIIGKRLSPEALGSISYRIGEGEEAVTIDLTYLEELPPFIRTE